MEYMYLVGNRPAGSPPIRLKPVFVATIYLFDERKDMRDYITESLSTGVQLVPWLVLLLEWKIG